MNRYRKAFILGLAFACIAACVSHVEAGIFGKRRCKRAKQTTCAPCPNPCQQNCNPYAATQMASSCGVASTCSPVITSPCGCSESPVCPCLKNPLPPGSHPCRCLSQYRQDLRCCECKHAGHPAVIAACKEAARKFYCRCQGHPQQLQMHGPERACDCSDMQDYGCPNGNYDEYMACVYQCHYECMSQQQP